MTEDIPTNGWVISAARAAGLALALLSPVGAPLLGFIIMGACDIPWEGSYRCFLAQPMVDYFLVFVFAPWIWVGPFLAILWLLLSLGILVGCLWFAGKTIWQLTMERL